MNAILEDPTETDYAEREAYSSTDQEAFDTDLRDYEKMLENEGWMYLYELGFSTWDEYEQHGLRDEDEERAEGALREEEADCEAWERWMERRECDGETELIEDEMKEFEQLEWELLERELEREEEEEYEFAMDTLWYIPIDLFDPYDKQEQQDHEQELDQAERNADREAYYEPEDHREWVLDVYGCALHHWWYEPGDPDAEEYFELLYTYKSLTGQL